MTSTQSVEERLQALLVRLQNLRRVDVGTFDEGDGWLCSFQEESSTGRWVDFDDIEELVREFSN